MCDILFRVDAGVDVGLGHYYRSVHLAYVLAERGFDVTVTYQPSPFWRQQERTELPFHLHPLDLDKGEDELAVIDRYRSIKCLYVDGFINYPATYLRKIKQRGVSVIFYQNLTDAKTLADIFILPSIHQGEGFFSDFTADTEVYQGLEYFTFNQQLSTLKVKNKPEAVKNMAFVAGGSDPKNTLARLCAALSKYPLPPEVQCTFYYGINYPFVESIPNELPINVKWRPFSHQSILQNDLVVSAFGVSTYEFIALGMPVVGYGHQATNAEALNFLAEKTGAVFSLGFIEHLDDKTLSQTLTEFVQNIALSHRLVDKSKKILDRKGVHRIAEIIETKSQHVERK